MNPRLSIILTLHDENPEYIEECISSIKAQTFQDFQIIAIDDFSAVDYSWLENEEKCIYIRNGRNLGLCRSVNKAFKLVNTEYCVRLGSDDIFDKNLLQKEIDYLDTHKAYVAVCCNLQKFGESTTLITRPVNWVTKIVSSQAEIVPAFHGYGYAGGMLFRSSVLECCRIDEHYICCEDFDFHLKLMEQGKIHSIMEPLYFYRAHNANYCKKFNTASRMKFLAETLKAHGLYYV